MTYAKKLIQRRNKQMKLMQQLAIDLKEQENKSFWFELFPHRLRSKCITDINKLVKDLEINMLFIINVSNGAELEIYGHQLEEYKIENGLLIITLINGTLKTIKLN